jgi:hypothetical protein
VDKLISEMLEGLQSAQFAMKGLEPFGDSVRERKPGWPVPRHLYLVYIGMNQDGLMVRQLDADIDPANLESEEDRLIALAAQSPVGDFTKIVFKQPSYFTIVLDKDDWEFYYPDPRNPSPAYRETHDPIIFLDEKAIIGSTGVRVAQPAERNKAFYNLEPVVKRIGEKGRAAIRCVNFFTRNDAGDPVEHNETIDYAFNLFLRIPFSNSAGSRKITIIIDPDSQNQGPVP